MLGELITRAELICRAVFVTALSVFPEPQLTPEQPYFGDPLSQEVLTLERSLQAPKNEDFSSFEPYLNEPFLRWTDHLYPFGVQLSALCPTCVTLMAKQTKIGRLPSGSTCQFHAEYMNRRGLTREMKLTLSSPMAPLYQVHIGFSRDMNMSHLRGRDVWIPLRPSLRTKIVTLSRERFIATSLPLVVNSRGTEPILNDYHQIEVQFQEDGSIAKVVGQNLGAGLDLECLL